MENKIKLGTNWYVLAEGSRITRQPLQEWTANIRTTGQQQRADRAFVSTWPIKDVSYGVGLKRIDIDNPDHFKRLWDATAETRFPGQVTPSLEATAATKTGATEIVSKIVYFKGDYFCLGANGTNLDSLKWNSGTSNWDKAGDVVTMTSTPCDLVLSQDGGTPCLLASYLAGSDAEWRKSTDGATWSTPTDDETTGYPPCTRTLLVLGTEIFIATVVSDIITIWKKTDVDATESEVCKFPASDVTGWAVFWDTAGNSRPMAGTSQGWWMIDTANDKAVFYGDLTEAISTANCVQMVNWNNYLMIPTDGAGMIMYDADGDSVYMGLDLDDGLVSEAQGDITAMTFSNLWLFVAVGGGAALKYARVWAYDGIGWHCVYRHATANQTIKYLGFIAGALHIVYNTGAGTTSELFVEDMLVNPVTSSGISWNDDSYITLPEYDGGVPEFGMGIYRIYGDADDLVDDDEYLSVYYGTNGASVTTTDLGDINATTKSLAFGSGVGIQCTRIQPHIILKRSAAAKAPKLKSLVLSYLVKAGSEAGGEREIFTFTIDAVKTSLFSGEERTIEKIITDLDTIRATKTLTAFQYGRLSAINVLVLEMPSIEEVREAYNELQTGEREALITCRVVEM